MWSDVLWSRGRRSAGGRGNRRNSEGTLRRVPPSPLPPIFPRVPLPILRFDSSRGRDPRDRRVILPAPRSTPTIVVLVGIDVRVLRETDRLAFPSAHPDPFLPVSADASRYW